MKVLIWLVCVWLLKLSNCHLMKPQRDHADVDQSSKQNSTDDKMPGLTIAKEDKATVGKQLPSYIPEKQTSDWGNVLTKLKSKFKEKNLDPALDKFSAKLSTSPKNQLQKPVDDKEKQFILEKFQAFIIAEDLRKVAAFLRKMKSKHFKRSQVTLYCKTEECVKMMEQFRQWRTRNGYPVTYGRWGR